MVEIILYFEEKKNWNCAVQRTVDNLERQSFEDSMYLLTARFVDKTH